MQDFTVARHDLPFLVAFCLTRRSDIFSLEGKFTKTARAPHKIFNRANDVAGYQTISKSKSRNL